MITSELVKIVLDEYELNPFGIHGVTHWGRVLETGLRIADSNGANHSVIQMFALFHDSRRVNDIIDPEHGRRGAEFAKTLRNILFTMPDDEFDLFCYACQEHTSGFTEADPTVQACWDADRLDLYRCHIMPDPDRLCTQAGKDPQMIAWANQRATEGFCPEFIKSVWKLSA